MKPIKLTIVMHENKDSSVFAIMSVDKIFKMI
jgi:hypothetical protein